jgi:hypothetical protein
MHTITLTESGALVLHDHPDLITERALVALGGKLPRCLAILEAWKQKDRATLPPALRPAFDKRMKKLWQRASNKYNCDPLDTPIFERTVEKATTLAHITLGKCAYKRQEWPGNTDRIRIGKPDICGMAVTQKKTIITVTIPPVWLARVYRRGLAVVDGWFVLDVLAEDEKGYLVLAGRQGKEFEIYPSQAWVNRSADGNWHLRWVWETRQQ